MVTVTMRVQHVTNVRRAKPKTVDTINHLIDSLWQRRIEKNQTVTGIDQPTADRPIANKVKIPVDTKWRYLGAPRLVNNPYGHCPSPPSGFRIHGP